MKENRFPHKSILFLERDIRQSGRWRGKEPLRINQDMPFDGGIFLSTSFFHARFLNRKNAFAIQNFFCSKPVAFPWPAFLVVPKKYAYILFLEKASARNPESGREKNHSFNEISEKIIQVKIMRSHEK